jgi:hypothetical protein
VKSQSIDRLPDEQAANRSGLIVNKRNKARSLKKFVVFMKTIAGNI